MATITADPGFNPEAVSETLRKAMKGLGTDEKAIIAELTKISNAQRLTLILAYKQMFGRDLVDDLKSELGGKLEKVVLALMTHPLLYDAREIRAAMKGLGTDEGALIEILATRTNQEIATLKAAYTKDVKRDLEKDLVDETSGHFKKLLVSLCNGCRDESSSPDRDLAKQNAEALHQAGAKKWGTDEAVFNRVMCSLSHAQLRLVFEEYEALSLLSGCGRRCAAGEEVDRVLAGKPIEKAIQSEMSGSVEDGMLAIVACSKDLTEYFASKLYKAMKGAGTDDNTLIRIIVSRSEKDLEDIKQAFERLYGKPLAKFVDGDCSGDYKKILLALVR